MTDPQADAADSPGSDGSARQETRQDARQSALDGAPTDVSALKRAAWTCQHAVGAGFHWKEARGALDKLEEEVEELKEVLPTSILREAMAGGPNSVPEGSEKDRIEHELGDVLMAAAFVGGYLGLDPEALCHRALERFDARFRVMETDLGGSFSSATMDEMLVAWTRAKKLLDDPARPGDSA